MTEANKDNFNRFLPILDNWENYFSNPDEGLGTTYERFLLHKIFAGIDRKFTIRSVLEVPVFGMTGISGINSLWWAREGKNVTLIDDNSRRLELIKKVWQSLNMKAHTVHHENFDELPVQTGSMDLVWNFAALWFIRDISTFSSQLKRISGKVILISVPNNRGIGYLVRKRYVQLPNGIYLNNLEPSTIKQHFSGNQWDLWDEGIFDIPPWPDIPMKKEDLLAQMRLGWILNLIKNHNSSEQEDPKTILDYFSDRDAGMEKDILRFSFLENAPGVFQKIWGHHRYFIFVRSG